MRWSLYDESAAANAFEICFGLKYVYPVSGNLIMKLLIVLSDSSMRNFKAENYVSASASDVKKICFTLGKELEELKQPPSAQQASSHEIYAAKPP